MDSYHYRATYRCAEGTPSPVLAERLIMATDEKAAIRAAEAVDLDFTSIGANRIQLIAADGREVWDRCMTDEASNDDDRFAPS